MTQRDHILSIDAGTQSLRAMVFDKQGRDIAKSQVFFPEPEAPQPGWAEQSPEHFWNALCQACRNLWEKPDVDKARIAGLTVTSQRGSLVTLDARGKPNRPAILWLDQRRIDDPEPIGGWWGLLFRMVGVRHTIEQLQAKAQSNWIRRHEPSTWNTTSKILLVSGYLNYKLTGRFQDSVASQVAYLPFDVKRQGWANAGDWKWPALGIKPEQLPELKAPGESLGQVSQEAAHATGIPLGLEVIAGAADKACEVLGSGCHQPEWGHVSMGTAATFNLTSATYFEAEAFIPPYPAGIPHHYSVEMQTFRGFWMVSWFLRQFGQPEHSRASEEGKPAEHFLERLLETTPPGSDGLIIQPTWAPGIKTPGPEARGAMIGFHSDHTRAHIYRAMIEGQLFALFAAKERLEKRGRLKMKHLRCSGGASQSDGIMQIAADIFGIPAERPHLFETSALGAAMIASVGLNIHPNFDEAIEHMTRPGKVFQPHSHHMKTYRRLYTNIYKPMYKRLKPLYMGLHHLSP